MSSTTAAASTLYVIATLKAAPGKASALREVLLAFARQVRDEPGCVEYELHTDLDRPEDLVFYEVWQDGPSLVQHGKTEHYKQFVKDLDGLLSAAPDIRKFQRI